MLTHGHEDHIGAVPYLLAHKPDIPLVGSQFTLALVEAKLAERRIEPYTLTVAEGGRERLGPFECEFFAVNHSIPDALAVAIRTPAGAGAAHRRLQDGPAAAGRPDHRPGRLRPARRRGRRPAAVRLHQRRDPRLRHPGAGDRPGPRRRSSRKATGRIIVASFASHVHRVQQVLDSAHEHGRKVALIGRSMVRNMGIARDLGLLRIPPGLVVGLDEATALPPERDRADVHRLAGRADERAGPDGHRRPPARHDRAGDTVVLASSLVPGNETSVYRVINQLSRAGAIVIHKDVAKVHVSGHAPAGELLYLLNVVRPSNLMPVHGEWRHLRAHARLGDRVRRPGRPGRALRGRRRGRPGRGAGHAWSGTSRAATSTWTVWPSATSASRC